MFPNVPTTPSASPTSQASNNQAGHNDPNKVSKEEIYEKPWKYIGYKGYSEFIARDDDLLIFRRFNSLNARVALLLQDEISVLEEQLNECDEVHCKREAADIHNGVLRGDVPDRRELLDQIARKLCQYNEFILQLSGLRQYPRAPCRDVENIKTWHQNYDRFAIAQEEQNYLEFANDLICLVQKDKAPLRRLVDSSAWLRTLSIWKDEKRDEKREIPEYDADRVFYYADKRIDKVVSALIVAVGVIMLITPIWILEALESVRKKLAVITVFVLVFLLVLSYMMPSKPLEALGATAAYAAILTVFIQAGT